MYTIIIFNTFRLSKDRNDVRSLKKKVFTAKGLSSSQVNRLADSCKGLDALLDCDVVDGGYNIKLWLPLPLAFANRMLRILGGGNRLPDFKEIIKQKGFSWSEEDKTWKEKAEMK